MISSRGKLVRSTIAFALSFALAALEAAALTPARKTPAGYPQIQSLHIPMRDGVRIAVDLWLPPMLRAGEKIPTLMHITPYWRSYGYLHWRPEMDSNFEEAIAYNTAGYAYLLMDVRGSGASFGSKSHPFSKDEIEDTGEVIDWIVKQPWSDGGVGAIGISYPANAAELTAATGRAAVKALVPRFGDFDPFQHLFWPGGVFNERFAKYWGAGTRAMDLNDLCAARELEGIQCYQAKQMVSGVRPVDADIDGVLVAAAVKEHLPNIDIFRAAQGIEFADDRFGDEGPPMREIAPFGHERAIERSGAPLFIWASWVDAGTAEGALSRFFTFENPQSVIIGAWSHGAGHDGNPYMPPDFPVDPPMENQTLDAIRFFDAYMKKNGPAKPRREIRYFTMGENAWKTTSVWPPKDAARRRYYFAEGAALASAPPRAAEGADEYAINYEATTGQANRWYTQNGGWDVVYPDRSGEDQKLLVYTSPPLAHGLEITGHPVVSVELASTHEDGALFAYLEEVDPNGRVTFLTEGMLRLVNRKVSNEKPPYKIWGPYHSCLRKDAAPMMPGEFAKIEFSLFPTSVLIRAGHRIRVALAGADRDNFARYPAEGTPTITVARNAARASFIEFPAIER